VPASCATLRTYGRNCSFRSSLIFSVSAWLLFIGMASARCSRVFVRVDAPLTLLALLQLLFIALIPVATGLFHGHSKGKSAPRRNLFCDAGGLRLRHCRAVVLCRLRPAMVHPQSRARDYWERFTTALVAPLAMTWFAATGGLSTASRAGAVALLLVCRLVLWRLRQR